MEALGAPQWKVSWLNMDHFISMMIAPSGLIIVYDWLNRQPIRSLSCHFSMNPWAWNMNANMIYLEAPVGVGFSKGSADDMKHISDDTTSSDNRDALKVKIRTDRTDQTVRPRLTFQNYSKLTRILGLFYR